MRRSKPDTPAVLWARTVTEKPGLAAELVWVNADSTTTYCLRDEGAAIAYLKVGAGALAGERDRFLWLRGKVAVPAILGFASHPEGDWLLTAPLRGAALNRPEHTAQPHRLVRLLVSALKRLHALDPARCPFAGADGATTVVHGDATLPNFIFEGVEFTGCLDVGDVRPGRPEVDLAAAV